MDHTNSDTVQRTDESEDTDTTRRSVEVVHDHNRITWEAVYQAVDPLEIVEQAREVNEYLTWARRTHQSERLFWDEELLSQIRGRRVLEIGGGDGRMSVFMLALGAGHVTLQEITPSTEHIAKECLRQLDLDATIDVRVGDPLDIDLGGPYDVVIARRVVHHIPTAIEDEFVAMLASYTADDGWVRVTDPAVNSPRLDALRWALPAPGRPSRFSKEKFAAWKEQDPHPDRDNSTRHVESLFRRHFREVHSETTGGVSRLHRWVDSERYHDPALRALNAIDSKVPERLQRWMAAFHSISASQPIRPVGDPSLG